MKRTHYPFVFVGLAPHPPVIVPAVGCGREEGAHATVAAMRVFARRFMEARPEVLVLVSPHSPRRPGKFGYWTGEYLSGNFAQFNAPDAAIELPGDEALTGRLRDAALARGIHLWSIQEPLLDHGATVPLWFLWEAGWRGRTVVLGLNYPGEGQLEELGAAIAEAVAGRAALIASGDMSHRLNTRAPGGFHASGERFDQSFVGFIERGELPNLRTMEPGLVEEAGQDVLETTLIAMAAIGFDATRREVLSYEGPFGVGYTVAIFWEDDPADKEEAGRVLLRIARETVERYVTEKEYPRPREENHGYLSRRAAVFVTVWKGEELRGCIGVLRPTQPNLAMEVADRAIAVATSAQQGRFEREELPDLTYEVSVLSPSEPVASTNELDPAHYGIIIRDDDGHRALLLPGIKSITTVKEQVHYIHLKAGIKEGAPIHLEKFVTDHFTEGK